MTLIAQGDTDRWSTLLIHKGKLAVTSITNTKQAHNIYKRHEVYQFKGPTV